MIQVFDKNGNKLEPTYLKRAKGLVKKGRARFINESAIVLDTTEETEACPPIDKISEDMKMFDAFDHEQMVTAEEETAETKILESIPAEVSAEEIPENVPEEVPAGNSLSIVKRYAEEQLKQITTDLGVLRRDLYTQLTDETLSVEQYVDMLNAVETGCDNRVERLQKMLDEAEMREGYRVRPDDLRVTVDSVVAYAAEEIQRVKALHDELSVGAIEDYRSSFVDFDTFNERMAAIRFQSDNRIKEICKMLK